MIPFCGEQNPKKPNVKRGQNSEIFKHNNYPSEFGRTSIRSVSKIVPTKKPIEIVIKDHLRLTEVKV